jgi:poly-gamma-glutamate synthesis protein (capsule biosynthesis protein)
MRILDGMREEFARAALVFVNLEEPITRSRTVTPYKSRTDVTAGRDYILRARNAAIPRQMKEAGVGLVGLANNHMMDYTAAGLRDTLRAFRQAGLPVVGAGLKPDAERPFILEGRGGRVALMAFSDVVPRNYGATETQLGIASSKRETDLMDAIRRARRRADFVVLMVHWGGQVRHLITVRQRRLARLAVEAGCDAVVGMHPHVLQGAEYIGRVPVFYSVGNFAFASQRPASQECVLVRLAFGPRTLEEVELVPVEISPAGVPRVAEGERGREILGNLDGFCRMFNTGVKERKLVLSRVREPVVYDRGPTRGSSVVRGVRKDRSPGRRGNRAVREPDGGSE